MLFEILARTEGFEVYCIEAASEEEARDLWSSDMVDPLRAEIESAEIVTVKEIVA